MCNYFIVSVFYASVAVREAPTDDGPLRVAATARGVAAVEVGAPREAFEAALAGRGLVPDERAAGAVAAAHAEAGLRAALAMLEGAAADASAVAVDLGDRPAWDRLVLDAVRAIPRGSTAGYGEVARWIGRPGAARAVGGAVGRNPVGLLVPCHRVIAGDGTLGGYGVATFGGREGALERKRQLLALEGVIIERREVSAR
jgi:methylated-DNA-[protein]-cysteine S-methyltransferase